MTEGQTLAPGPLENGTRSSPQGAGRLLSAGLPGLPQLIGGRWGAGSMALLTWLGNPSWSKPLREADLAARQIAHDEIDKQLQDVFAKRDRDTCIDELIAAGIPAAALAAGATVKVAAVTNIDEIIKQTPPAVSAKVDLVLAFSVSATTSTGDAITEDFAKPVTVAQLCQRGTIPPAKLANRWIISRGVIEKMARTYVPKPGRPRNTKRGGRP